MIGSDFTDNSLTGIVTVSYGNTSFIKTLTADLTTEGLESFVVNLRTGSISGPIVATSPLITVFDTSTREFLYSFTSHTFTTGGATGRNGPTSFASVSSYTSTSWYSSYFSVSSGIQSWIAPTTGNYLITAAGAAGHNGFFSTFCRGIVIQSTIYLVRGTSYKILVGQKGLVYSTSSGGGGGGTFMTTSTNVPVIVAGGGGGACYNTSTLYSGSDGQSGTSGSNSSDGYGTGGSNGSGGTGAVLGSGSRWGGGGGGLNSNGTNAFNNGSGLGFAFVNGGTGGDSGGTSAAYGGFGGGAGTHGNAGGGGGGGGYSGGGGSGEVTSTASAGGGGSYSQGSITVNGYNTGHGYLTITLI